MASIEPRCRWLGVWLDVLVHTHTHTQRTARCFGCARRVLVRGSLAALAKAARRVVCMLFLLRGWIRASTRARSRGRGCGSKTSAISHDKER